MNRILGNGGVSPIFHPLCAVSRLLIIFKQDVVAGRGRMICGSGGFDLLIRSVSEVPARPALLINSYPVRLALPGHPPPPLPRLRRACAGPLRRRGLASGLPCPVGADLLPLVSLLVL